MPPSVRHALLRAALPAVLSLLALAPAAMADAQTGGASPGEAEPAPTGRAIVRGGKAIAPPDAPLAVRRAIRAANRIARKPYRYGGGHASFRDRGYDCSGTASYVLRGARLLTAPMPSGPFMKWGEKGPGRWITVYANRGHMFLMIAGLRFDTGYRSAQAARMGAKPGRGPRWDVARPTAGFSVRHPAGL